MPIYNVEKYVDAAIKSILNQKFQGIELILINDGSTDNSLQVMKRYESNDNVKVISQKNCGLGNARNRGYREANGKYLLFMDADDLLLPDFLSEMYMVIENTNADVLMYSYEILGNNTITSQVKCINVEIYDKNAVMQDLMKGHVPPMAWGYFVKRGSLRDDSPFYENTFFEDEVSTAKIFYFCRTFVKVGFNRPPYLYRKRQGSIMSKYLQSPNKQHVESYFSVFKSAKEFYLLSGIDKREVDVWLFSILAGVYLRVVNSSAFTNSIDSLAVYKSDLIDMYSQLEVGDFRTAIQIRMVKKPRLRKLVMRCSKIIRKNLF